MPFLGKIFVAYNDEATLYAGECMFNTELCTTPVAATGEIAWFDAIVELEVVAELIGRKIGAVESLR